MAISTSIAQYSSNNGRFEANYVSGCSPLKVIITETDTFPPETVRQYDFNGDGVFVGFEPDEEVSYTYTDPGDYRVVQVINIDIVPKTDTLDLSVFSSTNPDFEIFTCENNDVKIEIEEDQYDQYKVFFTPTDSIIVSNGQSVPVYNYSPGTHDITVEGLFSMGKENCGTLTKSLTTIEGLVPAAINSLEVRQTDPVSGVIGISYDLNPDITYQLEKAENLPASFQSLGQLTSGSSGIEIDSVDTRNTVQIFRISAYDACQDKKIYSNVLSSIVLEVNAENSQNRIEWETYPEDFVNYRVYRDNQLQETIPQESRTSAIDKEVTCFTEYCYTVSYSTGTGAISRSDTTCVEAFKIYFPPPIKNTTASIVDDQVQLSWIPPDNIQANSFFIQRRLDEDIYSTLDTIPDTLYLDNEPDVNTSKYCYRISYLDECQNRSNLGDLSCTVNLGIEDNRILRWTDYLGWSEGVSRYIVEVYNENNGFIEEIPVGADRVYEIEDWIRTQINRYRIRTESNSQPAKIAYSNFVLKEIESVLWLPNAFTPDGNGLNDVFKTEGTIMQQFNMKIFSRAGVLIFETDEQTEGWDGTYNGESMPLNTYIYKVEAVDNLGKTYNLTGKLMLIRE